MDSKHRMRASFELAALAIVILFPLTAIGWYLFSGMNPATTPAVASATVSAPAPSAVPAASSATSISITLDNPASVPSSVSAGQIMPFSFTLTNTGSSATTVAYKVYVRWNNGEDDVLDRNSISLAAGASTDIAESLKFETAGAAGRVSVEAGDPVQSIDFAVPRD